MKMKKILAVILASAMVLGLAACGGSSDSADTGAKEEEKQEESGEEAAALPKVAMIATGAINDGGWNQSAYNGITRVGDELGCEIAYSEKVEVAELPNVARTYAKNGFNVIIGHGAECGEPLSTIAPEFPDVTFVAVNSSLAQDNLSGTVYKFGENGYFCGMAAAMVSQTGVIACIPSDDSPNNKADEDTFRLGAQAINPDIKVLVAYTGSWDDLQKAKECAESVIEQGADVILSMGDAYSIGIYQAAEEAGNVYACGWVMDQSALSDTVICSGMQDNAQVYVNIVKAMIDGTFEPGVSTFGMADGSQAMAFSDKLTDDQIAQIQEAIDKYLAGELEIPTLY